MALDENPQHTDGDASIRQWECPIGDLKDEYGMIDPVGKLPDISGTCEGFFYTAAVDENTQTAVLCPQCGTKATWRGPITDDMLARSFTRGLASSGLPNCPRCGAAFELVQVAPIESPIQTAADLMAAQQPRLPGLLPRFDFQSAFTSIVEQRAAVRRAQATAEEKHKHYSSAKKRAEEEQATLSKLEDDYADRARDARYERDKPTITGGPCLWEQAHPGKACPICRAPGRVYDEETSHETRIDHLLDRAMAGGDLSLEELRAVVAEHGELVVTDEEAATLYANRLDVLAWLKADGDEVPAVLGRAHVVDERPDHCRDCHALIAGAAAAYGLEAWTPGQYFGLDCDGPVDEGALEDAAEGQTIALGALKEILGKAGADVSLEDIAGWTEDELEEAATWATETIQAHKEDPPGKHTSIVWPDHVSLAHNGPELRAHRPTPRHATKAARQQAKQKQGRPKAKAGKDGYPKPLAKGKGRRR
jgi:hypothetical protein